MTDKTAENKKMAEEIEDTTVIRILRLKIV